ncbi:hypothetical protein [Rhodospirillum sp. A1_3_36]|uniref:phage head completion protein n=1 Tax=Rhodospirillum sp. A1_3_36 TaxID=3391666 RepID=UPI0039A62BF8
MSLDLSAILSDPEFTEPLSLRVTAESVDDHGRLVEAAEVLHEIQASIQPASPDERESLPDGQRDKATVVVWTITDLDVLGEDAAIRFNWRGTDYLIQAVEPWPKGGYVRALATQEGVQ